MGKDLVYDDWSRDLLVATSSCDLHRLNLDRYSPSRDVLTISFYVTWLNCSYAMMQATIGESISVESVSLTVFTSKHREI